MLEEGKDYDIMFSRDTSRYGSVEKIKLLKVTSQGILVHYYLKGHVDHMKTMSHIPWLHIEEIRPIW